MSNKYIERFFMLTEQSILIDDGHIDRVRTRDETISSSRFLSGKSSLLQQDGMQQYVLWFSLLFFVASLVVFNFKKDGKVELSTSFLPEITQLKVIAKKSPKFISVIPGFRVSATKQLLHNVSLKKVDLALLSGNNYENEKEAQLLLMDKVIFVPKLFG